MRLLKIGLLAFLVLGCLGYADGMASGNFAGEYNFVQPGEYPGYKGIIKIKQTGNKYSMDYVSSEKSGHSCFFTAQLQGKIVSGNEVVFTLDDNLDGESSTITVMFGDRKLEVKASSLAHPGNFCGMRGIIMDGTYKKK